MDFPTPERTVELQDNFVTDAGPPATLRRHGRHRAAVAYIWSTPPVSFTIWRDAQNQLYSPDTHGTFAVFASYQEKKGVVTANVRLDLH